MLEAQRIGGQTMPGYTFFPPHPLLRDVVEAIWEADVPSPGAARTVVLPVVSPILCFHYRVPPALSFDLRASSASREWVKSGRHRITGVQTHAARLRPEGPVGGVMVRLRPEAAARVTGSMIELSDAAFDVSDVLNARDTARLDEQLMEAPDALARINAVQTFLLRSMRDDEPDNLVSHAIDRLRREPTLPIRQLAARLDVTDRHLLRRFRATTGATPKQFARILRVGRVIKAARACTGDWALVAQACGFADQAHLIHEFRTMVGSAPDAFFRATSLSDRIDVPPRGPESVFYNTFLAERGSCELPA